jgi:L-ascorbate metabolism protein UlaG (beta-lactamase superfamily)
MRIRYLGWSNIVVRSGDRQLCFDPFFRKAAGVRWAGLDDFEAVDVICLTHGHSEHFLDAHKVLKRTGARLVSSRMICDRLMSQFNVDSAQLVAVEPHEAVEIEGFTVTAFDWYHREINHFQFFGGNFFTGLKFSLVNLLTCPSTGPYFGFHIRTKEGRNLLNFSEGINTLFPTDAAEALGRTFQPDVMIAGAQLDYEQDMARIVAAVAPQTLIMYHPHEALFKRMNLKSSPMETFVECVRRRSPDVEIILPEVNSTVELKD